MLAGDARSVAHLLAPPVRTHTLAARLGCDHALRFAVRSLPPALTPACLHQLLLRTHSFCEPSIQITSLPSGLRMLVA
jgi:hypothetical protein